MLLGINRLLTEIRKEYILGNQHFTAGQVGFVFVAQTLYFNFSNKTTNTSVGRMID